MALQQLGNLGNVRRKLGLGSVADRSDHRNPRDGCCDDGRCGAEDQGSGRDPELRFPAADPDSDWRVGAVGLLLAVLHGIEAAIWAAAYVWLGALAAPKDAILYSLDSITTRGTSGLMLEPHWQIMGALESANGMLLFGISTAYIFAVMQQWWPVISGLLDRTPNGA